MSSSKPQFQNYPGTEAYATTYHYSQSVRVGNTIRTAGQGGWDATGSLAPTPRAQIDQALQNVLAALKAAEPSATWDNVVLVRSYHTDLKETFMMMPEAFKELGKEHRPIWTCVEVKALALEDMVVEIEVEAVL